ALFEKWPAGRQIGRKCDLAASSQDEDRWRAAQEGAHSGAGCVAGHFSKKNVRSAAPQLFQARLKTNPRHTSSLRWLTRRRRKSQLVLSLDDPVSSASTCYCLLE